MKSQKEYEAYDTYETSAEKKPAKNYYRKSDGGGMFIDGLPDEGEYTPGEIRSKINDIKNLEQKEKDENNGKMISDSYLSDEEINKTVNKVKAGMALYTVAFAAAIIAGRASHCAGLLIGLLLLSLSIMLFRNKQPEGYNQNSSKYMGAALGISGLMMIIFNLFFKDDTATVPMVFVLFIAIVAAGYLQNAENTEYMVENAKELIQAVCVDIEEKIVTNDEGSRYIERYPVFEIEYKGMHKRLKARFKYTNPPSIGTKRIIHINPDNLDEWYDPQNMKQM